MNTSYPLEVNATSLLRVSCMSCDNSFEFKPIEIKGVEDDEYYDGDAMDFVIESAFPDDWRGCYCADCQDHGPDIFGMGKELKELSIR